MKKTAFSKFSKAGKTVLSHPAVCATGSFLGKASANPVVRLVSVLSVGAFLGIGGAHAYTNSVNSSIAAQGTAPPPPIAATGATADNCNQANMAAIAGNIASQQKGFAALQTAAAPAGGQMAMSSCMGGLSSMVLPSLSINPAMIGQALKNAACNAVAAQVNQYAQPLYNAYGQYNPTTLLNQAVSKAASGAGAPGTLGGSLGGIAQQGITSGIQSGQVPVNSTTLTNMGMGGVANGANAVGSSVSSGMNSAGTAISNGVTSIFGTP